MEEFVLANNRGGYIKYDEYNGRYVETSNVELATTYELFSDAKYVHKEKLSNKQKKLFHIIKIGTPEATATVSQEKQTADDATANDRPVINIDALKKIAEKPVEPSIVVELRDHLDDFAKYIDSVYVLGRKISDQQAEVEGEICDIRHYIEFNDLNAYQGYLAFKCLQQALRRRRELKDTMEAIRGLGLGEIDTGKIRRAVSALNGMTHRKYQPRQLAELFGKSHT